MFFGEFQESIEYGLCQIFYITKRTLQFENLNFKLIGWFKKYISQSISESGNQTVGWVKVTVTVRQCSE